MIKTEEEAVEKTGLAIKKKVVKEAISVLKKLNEQFAEGKSIKPLFDDNAENPIYLQVTLKKIPPKKLKRMIKVQLPHSLLTDTTEICLITGDLDKRDKKAEIEPTIQHYKELLNKHGVKGISEVVPLRQLRTEYKTYESKRQLSAAYDLFLNDKKITGVLPSILGKAFYDKRKFPIQINLDTTNLKDQVERAVSETVFPISCRGNSCTLEVARISMDDNEILENILTCVKSLEDNVPGKWFNILGLYIKTAKSKAIPIYMTFDDSNELKIKVPRHKEKCKAEELSTVKSAEVKVFKDGRIIVKNLPCSEDENSADEAEDEATIKGKKSSEQEGESNSKENGTEIQNGEESQSNEEIGEEDSLNTKGKPSTSKKRKIKNEDNSIKAEDIKPEIKRKTGKKVKGVELKDKEIQATLDKQGEESQNNEENGLDTKGKPSKKQKIKNENDIIKDNTIKAKDIAPKIKRKTNKKDKGVKLEDEEIQATPDKQEAISNSNNKNLKSKRNKVAKNKDDSVCEINNEGDATKDFEEDVDIESSVQKNSRKRKSVRQSIKSELVADLNVIKKRRSQSNIEIKVETSAVAGIKTPKRKSKKLIN